MRTYTYVYACMYIENQNVIQINTILQRGGVAVVFGPFSTLSARHAINICDYKEIPYIDTRWDVHTKPPVINMHPHPHVIADLVADLVKAWEWQGFTILYESGKSLL